MDNPESVPSILPAATLSTRKEDVTPVNSKIAELTKSRQELQFKIQNLKQDMLSWRIKLDNQVKVYRDDLAQLKTSLNTEVEQLKNEFQELRTTLNQQQEDVTHSLRNLELQHHSGKVEATKNVDTSKMIDLDLPEDENDNEAHE